VSDGVVCPPREWSGSAVFGFTRKWRTGGFDGRQPDHASELSDVVPAGAFARGVVVTIEEFDHWTGPRDAGVVVCGFTHAPASV
jgi:hypothetical protein